MRTPDIEVAKEEDRGLILSLRQKTLIVASLYLGTCIAMLSLSAPTIVQSWSQILSTPQEPGNRSPGAGFVTFFQEDFRSLNPQWIELEGGTGTANLKDGSAFLNLTKESRDHTQSVAELADLHGLVYRWLYVATEIRLRCRTGNSLQGEMRGGGAFSWGIGDNYPGFPRNAIFFMFFPPQSIQSPGRFDALVMANGTIVFIEPLRGIDPTKWHNYTILWGPGNTTFLVDGEVVASTQKAPRVPLAIGIRLTNDAQYLMELGRPLQPSSKDPHTLLAHDIGIQVDYVKMFVAQPQHAEYLEEVNHTLFTAQEKILDAERKGMNATRMRDDMAAATQALSKCQYVPADLYLKLVTLAQLPSQDLLELANLFLQALERIQNLRSQGEDTRMAEGRLAQAEQSWNRYEFTLAADHLQRILDDEKT